jgi:hypothetical protein
MKKSIAVAALLAVAFAAPTVSVQAAPASDHAHCLVLPLLQADCREAIREHANAHHAAVKARVEARTVKAPAPHWWRCERAPAGSGYLLSCD